MHDPAGIDWEDAFLNGDYIDDGASFPAKWAAQAERFREQANCALDIAYGDHPREKLDLFWPEQTPRGLAVFIHGGYWRAFDKSVWSHLAAGAVSRGYAVAIPSYVLAPEARISQITEQVARAIELAAGRVAGRIHLAGHSAGGHLVTRMICKASPLDAGVQARIERVVSISGLHDLRPLLLNSLNSDLGMDENEAASESAVLHDPIKGPSLTAWVGAGERPEFLRQSALLVEAWGRMGLTAALVADPGRHHFDVIEGLARADHPLVKAFVG